MNECIEKEYLGLYIDILGQNSTLIDANKTAQEKYAPIKHFLITLFDYLELIKKNKLSGPTSVITYKDLKGRSIAMGYNKLIESIKVETFSDCIIVYTPLKLHTEYEYLGLIEYFIIAVSLVHINGINFDFPYIFRGAIDIAKAVEIEYKQGKKCLYGPLFSKLDKLEKDIKLPVVAVGECLMNKLNEYAGKNCEHDNVRFARRIRDYIKPLDNSKKHYIDFLQSSDIFAKRLKDPKFEEFVIDKIKEAPQIIKNKLIEIREKPQDDDSSVLEKYSFLKKEIENFLRKRK